MFRCLVALAALLLATPAYAAPKEDLQKTQQEIESANAKAAALKEQTGALEAELTQLQKELVAFARAQQKNEADLGVMEEKLHILSDEHSKKEAALAAQKTHLSAMVGVALKLSRVPAESIVMMPGDSQQTMKASRALSMASARIKQEIHAINLQMEELRLLTEKLAKSRDELREKTAELRQQRRELAAKVAGRKAIQAKLSQQQRQEKARIVQLAKKAEDLRQLITSLEDNDRRTRSGKSRPSAPGRKGNLRSFAAAKGDIALPSTGRIVQLFGKSRGQNETTKGIAMATPARAQVVAPYDGEVVYAGAFLNYGRLIIIRHSDDFHTLLSGLRQIDVSQGEFLLEGEPIGAMGDDDAKNRLYIEIRKNNQPVDPTDYLQTK